MPVNACMKAVSSLKNFPAVTSLSSPVLSKKSSQLCSIVQAIINIYIILILIVEWISFSLLEFSFHCKASPMAIFLTTEAHHTTFDKAPERWKRVAYLDALQPIGLPIIGEEGC